MSHLISPKSATNRGDALNSRNLLAYNKLVSEICTDASDQNSAV